MVDLNSITDRLALFFDREFDRVARVDDTKLLMLILAVVLVLMAIVS